MSLDKALRAFAAEVETGAPWPRPRCPTCDDGHIGFGQPDRSEAGLSLAERDRPDLEPEWIHGTFTLRGECENPQCKQLMLASGTWRVRSSRQSLHSHSYQGNEYNEFHRVESMYPSPMIMPVPKAAPPAVAQAVSRASRVLITDPGLAATALRSAVELFLTAEGVAGLSREGKFRNLDRRIKDWKASDARRTAVADLLLAVKWLGNKGTHEDSKLELTDVLEGAELLDEAFHRTYAGPDLDAQARRVIDKHGTH